MKDEKNLSRSRNTLSLLIKLGLIACLVFLGSAVSEGYSLTFAAAGDIMLDRGVRSLIEQEGKAYPLQDVRSLLESHDLFLANLECPLTDRGKPGAKPFVFRGDPDMAAYLKVADTTVLSLANNHILDWGTDGLTDTLDILKREGILPLGAGDSPDQAGKPLIIDRSGFRLLILAAYLPLDGSCEDPPFPGPYQTDPESLADRVESLRNQGDFMILSLHWGVEYSSRPNSRQRDIARQLIDRGADLILGHHPHVIQGIEQYRNRYIVYSLGNFIFDAQRPDDRDSFIFSARLGKNGLTAIRLIPVVIDRCRPSLARGEDFRRISHRLRTRSAEFGLFLMEEQVFLSIP